MIKLNLSNTSLSPHTIDILNATALTALPEGFPIDTKDIIWSLDLYTDQNFPVIIGKYSNNTFLKPRYIIHIPDGTMQLTGMSIDSESLASPINFKVTPLNEITILSKTNQDTDNPRQTHSQLSACSKLIQEIYKDDPDYSVEETKTPKVFFSLLELDYYCSNLAVTLEESILLWMETTYRLSVNLDDEGINVPLLLDKNIKRAFMSGPARNKVKIELLNGTQKDFSELTPSVQMELAREILSILPEI